MNAERDAKRRALRPDWKATVERRPEVPTYAVHHPYCNFLTWALSDCPQCASLYRRFPLDAEGRPIGK